MEFFDFGTRESFLFFQWLQRHSGTHIEKMVVRAAAEFETDKDSLWSDDTSRGTRDALAAMLEEELCAECANRDLFTSVATNCRDLESDDTLVSDLLVHAVQEINFSSVAEALLRSKGRWAPEKHRPELQ